MAKQYTVTFSDVVAVAEALAEAMMKLRPDSGLDGADFETACKFALKRVRDRITDEYKDKTGGG